MPPIILNSTAPAAGPLAAPEADRRAEKPEDASRVRIVNKLAFGQPTEADIVDRLRGSCADLVLLVAEDEAGVGHILFTPAVIESHARRVVGMGLAPLAVTQDRQRQGIGSQLVG